MTDRDLLRAYLDQTEDLEHPLQALEAVRELRRHLADVERRALEEARARGASVNERAQALGMTRQGLYYKLSHIDRDDGGQDIVRIPEADQEDTDDPSASNPYGDVADRDAPV